MDEDGKTEVIVELPQYVLARLNYYAWLNEVSLNEFVEGILRNAL